MKVLIGCEESQTVLKEFLVLGHDAYSNDIQDCSGGIPERHLKMDVFKAWELIQPDLFVIFPPCTHITKAGAPSWKQKQLDGRQQQAIDFVLQLAALPGKKAIENPVGILSSAFRKPDQIFHPYHFGDPYKKMTCLWLDGLPKLNYTNVVEPLYNWHSGSIGYMKDGVRIRPKTKPVTFADSKKRSKTFPGIAKAMAEQWGNLTKEYFEPKQLALTLT